MDDARRALAEDWTHYLILEVGQSLVERAGEFADAFALRGYNAVQLAAAHEPATEAERPVAFACADQRLARRKDTRPRRAVVMIPSIVASELQEAIRRFLYASFPMTTPGFRRDDGGTMLDDLLADPEAIFKGPYLGLGLPFRRMEAGAKLPFDRIDLSFAPYRHQFRAFERLCGPNPRSTLVATGTGSGKTECFSLPILDYCAGRPEQGVKAIIVYPMNALAADQARRFARDIHDRDSLRGHVSVGLYVGDTGSSVRKVMSRDSVITCRETLREYPPDILLTNYKMLDFLLLRPRDQLLWRYNEPNRLRYLVVDELHTFDGAQGTDLACLVRRLRDRLLPGDGLACVGTSATLGGESAGEELSLVSLARVFSICSRTNSAPCCSG